MFCVPGNHDVDQNIVKKSVPVYAVQKLLEESDHNNFQRYLDILKEEAKEKTVILLFGDHQPALEDGVYQRVMGAEIEENSGSQCEWVSG